MILRLSKPWPSLNEFAYSHWRKRYRYKKRVLAELSEELLLQVRKWNQAGKPYFRLVKLYRVGRIKDQDNLIGGAKTVLDVLVELGLIEDDSSSTIHTHYYQGPKNDPVIVKAVGEVPRVGAYIVLEDPYTKEG